MATEMEMRRYLYRLKAKWKVRRDIPSLNYFAIAIFVLFSACVSVIGATKCVHGTYVNDTCLCDVGWNGDRCQNCFGRVRYNATYGKITEGPGNYSVDTKCTWLIDSGRPNTSIHLWLEDFATECSWDHLYIYDGDSVFSPLVAVFSGLLHPRTSKLPELVTHSGYAYLHFFSDAAYNMSGFNITYQLSFCPKNCTGNGYCNGTRCECDPMWTGEACEIPVCPRNCSNNGVCDVDLMKCDCHEGYRGVDCRSLESEGVWNPVTVQGSFIPKGRASHKSVLHNDYIWVLSGSDFGDPGFQDIVRFHISSKIWENIFPKSTVRPAQRYGHSAVIHNNNIYMFGGLVGASDIVSELWSYNINTDMWGPRTLPGQRPVAVVGHTAHVVDNVMYVIFGHSPLFGYMNLVQECDLQTFTWQNASTNGAIVKGGYGHSSIYDPGTGVIYVHGGYHSRTYQNYYLSDSLYSYNPRTRTWGILERSRSYRYLHTASIISGMMLVFGGNTHNDSSSSQGAKCYSNGFLAYDLKCDKWYTKESPNLPWDISRFGHTATVHGGKVYVFGGFNGLMLHDMYEYTPGNCAAYDNKAACLTATPGIRCVWEDTNHCLHPDEARTRFEQKTIGAYDSHGCRGKTGDYSDICGSDMIKNLCPACVSTTVGCNWCEGICKFGECRMQAVTSLDQCPVDASSDCSMRHNCAYCSTSPACVWIRNQKGSQQCVRKEDGAKSNIEECTKSCHLIDNCGSCTAATCMWCDNEERCVESNSYVASYPYGQCMEWVTQNMKCPATQCSNLKTCSDCQSNPSCGWCDDGTNTGLGKCMQGSSIGPVVKTNGTATVDEGMCPAPHWYFTECPVCQCNGHSTCYADTSNCIYCEELTVGAQCEWCMDGYYGNATAGGNCTACQCYGQAELCDRVTGSCQPYCHARGKVGQFCDLCDEKSHYIGFGGTCYYNLTTDYRFTFNLSKKSDKYYKQISFMNKPQATDKDVEFMINCSEHALINITIRTATGGEVVYKTEQVCLRFDAKFSHTEYKFGDLTENTTFLVDVYDFKTPIWLEISFSQQPYIDLINFFIWFFSCFLSLLLISAVVWKIKLRYMLYRRRQRMLVQMQHMASRPFASANVTLDRPEDSLRQLIPTSTANTETLTSRRRKKPSKPSPITLETCNGQKAGILTLLVRLPCGDEEYTPPGQSGLAIASGLVTIGHHQQKSTAERSKSDTRHRIQIKPHTSLEPHGNMI